MIAAMIRFETPLMPGYEIYSENNKEKESTLVTDSSKDSQLYVACALVKPGKQYYLIN